MTASYRTISGTYDYGSIVRALQLQIAESGQTVKEYSYNYQGITEAIQDLTFNLTSNPGADIGPKPNNGDITIDANGDPVYSTSTPSLNGDLFTTKIVGIRQTVATVCLLLLLLLHHHLLVI